MYFGATKSLGIDQKCQREVKQINRQSLCSTQNIFASLMITNVPNLSDLLKHLFRITEKNSLYETE